jgi:rhodanese-related sulfurtransferase
MKTPQPLPFSQSIRLISTTLAALCVIGLQPVALHAQAPAPAAPAPVGEKPNIAKEVTVDEAEKLIREEKGLVVVDLRTPEEYEESHISGAVNVNFHDANFLTEFQKLGNATPILFHCGGGSRSTKAMVALYPSKFQKLFHMKSGLSGWTKAGKPVIEGKLPGNLQRLKEESEQIRKRNEAEAKKKP